MPKGSFGEFSLKLDFSDGINTVSTVSDIFLPSGRRTIGGLAVSEGGSTRLSLIGVILLGVLAVVLVGRFIYRHHARTRRGGPAGHKKRRKLLSFEM